MKKGKTIVFLALGFVLGAMAVIGIYFLTFGEVVWQEYVETKLIPNAVLALSSISALCVALLPIINKIQISLAKFNQATKDVNDAAKNGEKIDSAVIAQDKKISSFEERFDIIEGIFREEIASLKVAAENTERILRIGFCNTDELVRKGFAAEIGKVGAENVQNEEI